MKNLFKACSKSRALIFNVNLRFPRHCSSKELSDDEKKERELELIRQTASLDSPPTNCCGRGCANCVYVVWAEALCAKMEAEGPAVAQKVLALVDDPSMKAYLQMELRLRGLSK